MTAMDQSIQRLADAAKKLNEATDSLNDRITEIETGIRGVRVGLETWHAEPMEASTTHPEDVFQVGWAKLGSEWRLACRPIEGEWVEYEGNGWFELSKVVDEAQPLVNAPRTIRIFAIPKVKDLIDSLANEAEKCLDAIVPLLDEPNDDVPF